MKARLTIPAFAALLAATASSAVIDRIAVTVGAKAITESEVLRRIRLQAFQNGTLPDLSLASRKEAAQRLIDLKLVETEMDLGHYAKTPPEKVQSLLAAFSAAHFRSDREAMRLALSTFQLTLTDLTEEMAAQADFLSFTALRFRPAVQITDAEIEAWYRDNFRGPNPPLLDTVREEIEQTLIGRKTDSDLDAWLADQKRHTRINWLETELQ